MAKQNFLGVLEAQLQAKLESNRDRVPVALPNHTALKILSQVEVEGAIPLAQRIDAITARVNSGDLSDLTAMLVEQALLLNYSSADLTTMASAMRKVDERQTVFDMALKAQNACRKAILAINEIKNPRRSATFIKQQNNLISGANTDGREDMEPRAKKLAKSANPTVEAVAVQQRAKVGTR